MARLRLVRDDVIRFLHLVENEVIADLAELERRRAAGDPYAFDGIDQVAALSIARAARDKTILVDYDLVPDLVPALDRFRADGSGALDVRPPFAEFIIQFSEPVPEHVLFGTEQRYVDRYVDPQTIAATREIFGDDYAARLLAAERGEDRIDGLLVAVRDGHLNVVAWFWSTAVNRVAVRLEPGARLMIDDNAPFQRDPDSAANKRTLLRIALAIMTFLSAENVTIERQEPTEKQLRADAKRERKGKKAISNPPYYITKIRKAFYEAGDQTDNGDDGEHSGRQTPRLHPVRGHFRRLASGGVIWVRPHYRGVGSLGESERVYRIDPKPT